MRRSPRRSTAASTSRPAKAIEMAGKLYTRGQFAPGRAGMPADHQRPASQRRCAQYPRRVACRAAAQPMRRSTALKRAIKINPQASSYHANLGEVLRQPGKLDDAGQGARRGGELDAEQRAGAEQSRHHPLRACANSARRSIIIRARSRSTPEHGRGAEQSRQRAAHDRRYRRRDLRPIRTRSSSAPSIPRPTTTSAPCFSRTASSRKPSMRCARRSSRTRATSRLTTISPSCCSARRRTSRRCGCLAMR